MKLQNVNALIVDTNLTLSFCDYKAAKYAVMNWHYSKSMPAGKCVRIGVWEESLFIGVVIFSAGSCNELGTRYGLKNIECCELTRIALTSHKSTVSRIVSIALKMLKKHCPGIRLVVSFADPNQSHLGIIYQAGNWIYSGKTTTDRKFFYRGKWKHPRTISSNILSNPNLKRCDLPQKETPGKHRYLMPMDKTIRCTMEKFKEPFPKCG